MVEQDAPLELGEMLSKGQKFTSAPVTSSSIDAILKRLKPPVNSDVPYNLDKPKKLWFSQYQQDQLVAKAFRKKTKGFFIEAGALKGESLSNTLYLERELGWTGLLVEPVPSSYEALVSKNRKAYSINACFSPNRSALVMPIVDFVVPAVAKLYGESIVSHRGKNSSTDVLYVPCFPFFDILTALGNPVVDYFSLDIEGFEMKVLNSIPWDKVKIRLIGIEINNVPEGKAAVKRFMEEQGFKFYKTVVIDYFFYNPELADEIDLSFVDSSHL